MAYVTFDQHMLPFNLTERDHRRHGRDEQAVPDHPLAEVVGMARVAPQADVAARTAHTGLLAGDLGCNG